MIDKLKENFVISIAQPSRVKPNKLKTKIIQRNLMETELLVIFTHSGKTDDSIEVQLMRKVTSHSYQKPKPSRSSSDRHK